MDLEYIPGYNKEYSISRKGDVYSHKSNKFLYVNVDPSGYLKTDLCHKGKRKSERIHRLILKTYSSPLSLDERLCVNHKDGDKLNNCLTNLEWCTYSENLIHAFKLGLRD